MKKLLQVLCFLLLFFALTGPVHAAETIKPTLSWQRSTEAADKVVTETAIGTKLNQALALPLDPSQPVFDNGVSTAPLNKNAVAPGINWSSWRQFSAPDPFGGTACGPLLELRHFQASFNLGSVASIQKITLQSPYYPPGTFPINDNAYIYLNNIFITRFGTSYSARNVGMNGRAPYANETDGWVANGLLPQSAIQSLRAGPNTLDIITGETCRWGGMGKIELALEIITPTPFLDLPWDYQSQGRSFDNEALNPVSWFDHKYPLQNVPCCIEKVFYYKGREIIDFYRSHNGYDYGQQNGVELNSSVLAAASGWATFVSWQNTSGAGNVIKIDHGNGYQTWYEHLSSDDLVVSSEGQRVFVNKGQQVGRVGMTGNTTGPHIHFSVFQDTDRDGSFSDETPLGVVDPLGWEGTGDDPWPKDKGGAVSFNLFVGRAQPQSESIPSSGGQLDAGNAKITVPAGAAASPFTLTFKNGPFETVTSLIKSISPSFFLDAVSNLGQKIVLFSQPVTITYYYAGANLLNINEDTLKLYSFNDQTNQWEQITSTLDKVNKTITGQTTHFSQFAVMGEVKDLTPPSTQAIITGTKGQDSWYRSNVTLELIAQDNPDGVGLHYTLYTLNGNDWFIYTQPLTFADEGTYSVIFQSYDKAENTEERQTVTFNIDKTTPEAKIYVDPSQSDLVVEGVDANQTTTTRTDNPATKKKDDAIYTISDLAGNALTLDVRDRDKDKKDVFGVFSLQYNQSSPQDQPKNIYRVSYSPLRHKEQTFAIKDEVKIRIKYDAKKDQSTIITRENGQEKVKETRPGLILLQITTNQGKLEYSY